MSSPPDNSQLRPFGADIWFFIILVAGTGIAVFVLLGQAAVVEAVRDTIADTAKILPLVVVAIVVASLFKSVAPRELIVRVLGQNSGMKGLLVATVLGSIMPGGPFVSFPLVLALSRSGAAAGPLVAFITAWSVIGVNRVIVWELPFLGAEFAALRYVSSLPLPILAGLGAGVLARRFNFFRP